MNLRWLLVCALGLAVVGPAYSQVSVYADMSASDLTGGLPPNVVTNILYGPTAGLQAALVNGKHLKVYGEIRSGFYYGSKLSLDEVGVGPKIGFAFGKYELGGGLIVGFGRFNDGLNTSTSKSTDAMVQLNASLDRQVTKRFDWRIVDFGYQQYYGDGGIYNPKTFSTGLVFHITSR